MSITKKIFTAVLFVIIIILSHSCAPTKKAVLKPDIITTAVEDNTGIDTSQAGEGDEGLQGDEFDEFLDDDFNEDIDNKKDTIYDPIEPFNRVMFRFNDKLYYWLLKPVAKGYRFIMPEMGRVAIRRFFSNVAFPIRFVNSVLQLKVKSAGIELGRLIINSTAGIAGFMDPAGKLKLYKQDEDFGQTLGYYGVGNGFYITLPFLGPSSLRDSIGLVGDTFLDPATYLPLGAIEIIGITAYDKVNETSIDITLYDDLVKKAFDPYIFMRNAYYQNRESKVKE